MDKDLSTIRVYCRERERENTLLYMDKDLSTIRVYCRGRERILYYTRIKI